MGTAYLKITSELVEDLLKKGAPGYQIINPLPPDAVLVGAEFFNGMVRLYFRSKEFPVPEGEFGIISPPAMITNKQ